MTRKPIALVPYTPNDWTPQQAQMHQAGDMEEALHHACCLAGGWYRRPIAIDMQITGDNDERYMLRPAEVPVLDGWTAIYELKAVR